MSLTTTTYTLIKKYALKNKSREISFQMFLRYLEKYAEKFHETHEVLKPFVGNAEPVFIEQLLRLEQEKKIALEYHHNNISKIIYLEFVLDVITKEYTRMETEAAYPFPNEDNLSFQIPPNMITPVDIKNDFVNYLERKAEPPTPLLRLTFTDGIKSVVIPSSALKDKLIDYCLGKIRVYLNTQKNKEYLHNKLLSVLKERGLALRETLNKLMFESSAARNEFMKPNEFTFRFWAYLVSFIIKEYREKTSKLSDEHSYCQASFLLGMYNVYHKGQFQKEKDLQGAFNTFDNLMRKTDAPLSITDLYNFKDPKGVLLTKKYSKEKLNQHLEEKTKRKDNENVAEVLKLAASDKKMYYVHKNAYIPYLATKVFNCNFQLRKHYVDSWLTDLKNYTKNNIMTDDALFREDLEQNIREREPLVLPMLNYAILFLIREDFKDNPTVTGEIEKIIDLGEKNIKPIEVIFNLHRKDLYAAAKAFLPLWESSPFLRAIIGFFKKMFKKKKHKKKDKKSVETNSSAQITFGESPQEKKKSYKEMVEEVKKSFIEDNVNISTELKRLSEKWNPLFDEAAKKNYVEDVNSLIKDYVRTLKRTFRFRPPDAPRIVALAEKLSENKHFSDIRRKDPLLRYIELYMIKMLLQVKTTKR